MMTVIWVLATLGCGSEPAGHGHGHGHPHGAGDQAHHGAESIAITRWTEHHELFVELDAPVTGQAFAYHAHVTRLADNHAVTSGTLTIRFEQEGFVVESHTDEAVARSGIFAAEATPPSKAGSYQLVFRYVDGDERAEWQAGEVQVGDGAAVAHADEAEGEIAFLKEAQWLVPFRVEPAVERALAPVVEAAGVVHPAPQGTTVVAAPVEGLLAWVGDLPVEGRAVERGERLATLVPAGATEHWAVLQAELATARIDRDLAKEDLARLEELGDNELISDKRLDDARAALARAEAQVQSAERRLSALTSGGAGAVAIRAPADGVIVAVGAGHGEAVSAGAPLVTVSADDALLLEGRVHQRTDGTLEPVHSLTVQRGDWDAPKDLLGLGAVVLSERLVYDPATLSATVSVLVPGGSGLAPGDLVELGIGVGQGSPRLVVPRSAAVEVNGQDVVFVQMSGESFSRRRVALGVSDATHVEVSQGLAPGEMVVVEGGFDVHVASLSGALESHQH